MVRLKAISPGPARGLHRLSAGILPASSEHRPDWPGMPRGSTQETVQRRRRAYRMHSARGRSPRNRTRGIGSAATLLRRPECRHWGGVFTSIGQPLQRSDMAVQHGFACHTRSLSSCAAQERCKSNASVTSSYSPSWQTSRSVVMIALETLALRVLSDVAKMMIRPAAEVTYPSVSNGYNGGTGGGDDNRGNTGW